MSNNRDETSPALLRGGEERTMDGIPLLVNEGSRAHEVDDPRRSSLRNDSFHGSFVSKRIGVLLGKYWS